MQSVFAALIMLLVCHPASAKSLNFQQILGKYNLISADGRDLPYYFEQPGKPSIDSGFIMLNKDSTYSMITIYMDTMGKKGKKEYAGSFRLEDGEIVFLRDNQSSMRAVLAEGVLKFSEHEGYKLSVVYRKNSIMNFLLLSVTLLFAVPIGFHYFKVHNAVVWGGRPLKPIVTMFLCGLPMAYLLAQIKFPLSPSTHHSQETLFSSSSFLHAATAFPFLLLSIVGAIGILCHVIFHGPNIGLNVYTKDTIRTFHVFGFFLAIAAIGGIGLYFLL